MKNNLSIMILNNENIGISKIELNKSDLLVTDKSGKYLLQVCIGYNWQELNSLLVGKPQNIDFNEYCFSENNENSLIIPTECYAEKLNDNILCFYLKFEDLSNAIYMNKRGHFDIKLKSLEAKIYVDYQDAINGSIIYKF